MYLLFKKTCFFFQPSHVKSSGFFPFKKPSKKPTKSPRSAHPRALHLGFVRRPLRFGVRQRGRMCPTSSESPSPRVGWGWAGSLRPRDDKDGRLGSQQWTKDEKISNKIPCIEYTDIYTNIQYMYVRYNIYGTYESLHICLKNYNMRYSISRGKEILYPDSLLLAGE